MTREIMIRKMTDKSQMAGIVMNAHAIPVTRNKVWTPVKSNNESVCGNENAFELFRK
jgi:hypothetical protein